MNDTQGVGWEVGRKEDVKAVRKGGRVGGKRGNEIMIFNTGMKE